MALVTSDCDVITAAEISLSLEKLNFKKLLDLRGLADRHNDYDMQVSKLVLVRAV